MKKFYLVIVHLFLVLGVSFSQINSTLFIPSVCEGEDLLLIIEDYVAGAKYTISGPLGTFPVATDTTRLSPAMPACNGEYSLYVKSPADTLTLLWKTTATVNPKPNLVLDVSPVCVGSQATITAIDVNQGTSSTSYTWDLEGTAKFGEVITFFPDHEMTCFVTATSAYGCIRYDSVKITLATTSQVRLSANPVCELTPLTVIPAEKGATFHWSTGETKSVVYPVMLTNPTIYTVTYTTASGCSFVLSAEIKAKPTADFTMDEEYAVIQENSAQINFIDRSTDAVSWHWNFGDVYSSDNESYVSSPYHDFTREGSYNVSLIVQAQNGCTDTTSRIIMIGKPFHFYIPNSFSPNGDGINDLFCVKGEGFLLENFYMRIYNRANFLIYKTDYIYDCWDGRYDGKYCQTGVYTAIIQVTTVDYEVKEYVVSITLIDR